VDLRQLRVFVAVAEELHFGRAARRLHLAQPAVSQHVRSLEAELGVVLLERTSRRVGLTPAGQLLLDGARDLLARHDRLVERLAQARTGHSGEVGLGVTPALPPDLLPALLTEFRRRLPEVTVVARSLTGDQGADAALDTPGIDIAMLRGDISMPGVSTLQIAREPVGVALPAAHPLAARASLSARDLEGLTLATFARHADPAGFDRIFAALRAAGLRAYRLHESAPGAVEASLRLVKSGIAVSLKLESEVRAMGDDSIIWRPLNDPPLDATITAAWRPDRLTPAGRQVVRVMRDHR
jgi:DNA-binding transcriptional LysR family regulator